ncbi:MAG: ribosome recycling factor [Armatimonadetes bacterium]|nr:ribosome recycling factor [Armatimonadota bacterium]
MSKEIIQDAERRMKKAVEVAQHDYSTIRTGRANPMILEGIKVDYFGTPTPINQVAGVSTPEARQIMISPWDRSTLEPIVKAIQASDLGLVPQNDGLYIRLNIPHLNEERRKDLIKQLHKKAEEHKVAVRNVRRDANEHLKGKQKSSEISEDELKRAEVEVQKLTDKYIVETDKLTAIKEAELREV